MKHRTLSTTGKSVPIIGQGTWEMERNPQASFEALRRGIDLGLTHIDTAEMYGSGKVESLVGKAIDGYRQKIFLVSKVLPSNASYKGTIEACEQSLKRLRTDHLDLYLLHWPGNHPFEETVRAFEQLTHDGKIAAYGVSNFNVSEMEKAVKIAGTARIACNQVLYHLKERAIENTVMPWCLEKGIALVAYSPFGSGQFPSLNSPAGKTLTEIAHKHKATRYQVALQYLVRVEGTFTIPKASTLSHVEENSQADLIQLDEEDIKIIEQVFPRGNKKTLPMI